MVISGALVGFVLGKWRVIPGYVICWPCNLLGLTCSGYYCLVVLKVWNEPTAEALLHPEDPPPVVYLIYLIPEVILPHSISAHQTKIHMIYPIYSSRVTMVKSPGEQFVVVSHLTHKPIAKIVPIGKPIEDVGNIPIVGGVVGNRVDILRNPAWPIAIATTDKVTSIPVKHMDVVC